jgi:hypothetical protein
MRTLFDEDGNKIEVPDEKELTEQSEKLKKMEEELKVFNENKGVKNLREVLSRRDDEIRKLQAELAVASGDGEEKKIVKEDDKKVDLSDPSSLDAMIADSLRRQTVASELTNRLKGYSKEEAESIERDFKKLTEGETVSTENLNDFFSKAVRSSIPDAKVKSVSVGGLPPRINEEAPRFTETEEGKRTAELFGFGQVRETK